MRGLSQHGLLRCRTHQRRISLIVLDHSFDRWDAEDGRNHQNENDQQEVIDDKPSQPSSRGEVVHGLAPIVAGEPVRTIVFTATV